MSSLNFDQLRKELQWLRDSIGRIEKTQQKPNTTAFF
jgi:hypothetical protein